MWIVKHSEHTHKQKHPTNALTMCHTALTVFKQKDNTTNMTETERKQHKAWNTALESNHFTNALYQEPCYMYERFHCTLTAAHTVGKYFMSHSSYLQLRVYRGDFMCTKLCEKEIASIRLFSVIVLPEVNEEERACNHLNQIIIS